jgi:hypothetical protein
MFASVGAVGPHVDDGRPGPDHVPGDQLRLTRRGDQDLGAPADLTEVTRAAVADRHRGVGAEQEREHRPADQVGPSNDHRLLAGRIHSGGSQQLHDSSRCAGHEPGLPARQAAGADRRQAVDVLLGVERVDDRVGVDLIRHRQLNQDPVHLIGSVELLHQVEQLLLGD